MKNAFTLPQLPAMQCDKGCGDCCGPVLCGSDEYSRIQSVVGAMGIHPVRQGSTCPLYIDGQCSVYDARPLVCRLMGHVTKLKCSRDYDRAASTEVAREWDKAIKRSAVTVRFIHELVYNIEEIGDILSGALTHAKGMVTP